MNTRTAMLVLSLTKIRENAVVLHTLSRDFGRRSFIATVSRTTPMALFLPLNILDAEVSENPRSSLWRIRNVSLSHPLNSIRSDVYKNAIALFVSEVLYRTVREGMESESLFDWCCKSVLELDALQSDFSNFHLLFLLGLTSQLGFEASVEDLAPFVGENLGVVKELVSLPVAGALLLPMSGRTRNDIAQSLILYLSRHTETAINVQSLKVLSEVLR